MSASAILRLGQDVTWPISQPCSKDMPMVSRFGGQGQGMVKLYCQLMRSSFQGCLQPWSNS